MLLLPRSNPNSRALTNVRVALYKSGTQQRPLNVVEQTTVIGCRPLCPLKPFLPATRDLHKTMTLLLLESVFRLLMASVK